MSCTNSHFIKNEPNKPSGVPTLNLQDRLQHAADIAAGELSETQVAETIEIVGEKHCHITIEDQTVDGSEFFVIYKTEKFATVNLIRVPKSSFRYIYIANLTNCQVLINCKLLRVMFNNCINTKVSLNSQVIGPVEFFRCTSSNIGIMSESKDIPPVPFVSVEGCKNIVIAQVPDEMYYLVKRSVDICCSIIDKKTGNRLLTRDLGKLFWNEQEQNLFRLTRENFTNVLLECSLNSITQNLIVSVGSGENSMSDDHF